VPKEGAPGPIIWGQFPGSV